MKLSQDQSPVVPEPDAPPLNPYGANNCGGAERLSPGDRESLISCRGAINTINAPSPGGTVTTLSGIAVSMDRLQTLLRSPAGRIVIDKTNLSGLYDFRIQFAQQPFAATPGDAVGNPSAPSLFIAVEQELGLKLVSAKGPVEVLIIDHAEKPDAN